MKQLTHAAIRRELALCIERLLVADDLPVTFYPHQREAYESALAWLRSEEPGHRRYFAHATGMGKSLHFIALIIEALKQQLRSLIVVSNKTLIYQIAREIHRFTGGSVAVGHISSLPVEIRDHEDDSIVYATKGWQDKSIVITTQDSLRTWAAKLAEGFDPHLIVRDEMHWSYTDPQLEALECFPEAVMLGYSATPDWLTTTARERFEPVPLDNGTTLYVDPKRRADTHFGSCLHRAGLRYGIERGVLAPLAWGEIDLSTISLDDVPVVNGPGGYDYDPVALAQHMANNWGFVMGVMDRLYATNEYGIRDLPVIAACPTIALAEEFARVVGKYTGAATVTGAHSHTERAQLFGSFDSDDNDGDEDAIRALSSVFVLREGTDLRNATVLLFLRATRSRVMYEQFLGRILRKRRDGREKTAIVLDPRYHEARFAPLNAPMLYGTPGKEVTRGGILIGPKTPRGGKKLDSPYIPKGVKVKIRVNPIEIEYWTNENGLVEIKGEVWGSREGLAKVLGVTSGTLKARISQSRSCLGKDSVGRAATLYSLEDMRKACIELLGDLPKTGKDGLVEIEDKVGEGELAEVRKEMWGVRYGLARALRVSSSTVEARVSQCRSRPGKDMLGKAATLYSLEDMRKACIELLGDLPKTGKDGLVEIEDKVGEGELAEVRKEMWGTLPGLAKVLGVSENPLRSRVSQSRSRPGLASRGTPTTLYSLNDMQKACVDIRGDLPIANAHGFIEIDGERWGTVAAFMKMFGWCQNRFEVDIGQSVRKREIRACNGKVTVAYREVDAKAYVGSAHEVNPKK